MAVVIYDSEVFDSVELRHPSASLNNRACPLAKARFALQQRSHTEHYCPFVRGKVDTLFWGHYRLRPVQHHLTPEPAAPFVSNQLPLPYVWKGLLNVGDEVG